MYRQGILEGIGQLPWQVLCDLMIYLSFSAVDKTYHVFKVQCSYIPALHHYVSNLAPKSSGASRRSSPRSSSSQFSPLLRDLKSEAVALIASFTSGKMGNHLWIPLQVHVNWLSNMTSPQQWFDYNNHWQGFTWFVDATGVSEGVHMVDDILEFRMFRCGGYCKPYKLNEKAIYRPTM